MHFFKLLILLLLLVLPKIEALGQKTRGQFIIRSLEDVNAQSPVKIKVKQNGANSYAIIYNYKLYGYLKQLNGINYQDYINSVSKAIYRDSAINLSPITLDSFALIRKSKLFDSVSQLGQKAVLGYFFYDRVKFNSKYYKYFNEVAAYFYDRNCLLTKIEEYYYLDGLPQNAD